MNAAVELKRLGANGVMPVKFGFNGAYFNFDVIGGPFDAYKPGVNGDFGICVRRERVPATADVVLPIADFSVPTDDDAVVAALSDAIDALLAGKRVYVGCMGGWGRTGLFFALLAKAAGVADPVAYVRQTYTPHAVETASQQRYVADFDVSSVQSYLFWQAWKLRWNRAFSWWL